LIQQKDCSASAAHSAMHPRHWPAGIHLNRIGPTAKATAREVKAAAVLAKHADKAAHTIKEQIAKNYSAIAEAVKQGKPAKEQRTDPTTGLSLAVDLKKELKELETVLKAKTSEENKAFGEELKALRAETREAVNKCTDLEQLQAALDVLSGGFDINYEV
jgi:hypothetical protein